MTMAAPTYMRSLTGTFSAAPHHSPAAASAWAAASASARSSPSSLSHHHHQHLSSSGSASASGSYSPSISTHNTHIYTHHLQNFNSHHERSYHHHLQPSSTNSSNAGMGPHHHHHHHHQAGMAALRKSAPGTGTGNSPPGLSSPTSSSNPGASGAGGRRRSSSIRSKNPPPFIKFDPFADEPLVQVASAPSPGAAARSADAALLNTGLSTLDAAPTEIQRYTSPSASSRRIIASQQTSVHSFNDHNSNTASFGPVNGGNGSSSSLRYAGPIGSNQSLSGSSGSLSGSVSAPVSRSSSPIPPLTRSTTSASASGLGRTLPLTRASSGPSSLGGPNVSKLVAGIMLNRVAVGKPMRRRVAPVAHAISHSNSGSNSRQYIKSGLSSVVSCEA